MSFTDCSSSPQLVKVTRTPTGEALPLPRYETAHAAGLDLRAAIENVLILKAGARRLIPTGLMIELPSHLEAQVRPRSGLALKHGIGVLNSPGTIDADYRGEIGVILVNHGDKDFAIGPGDRIAQLVVAPIVRIEWSEQGQLSVTDRGAGGFGSTSSLSVTQ